MEKQIELRVKNRPENGDKCDRQMARDLLTAKSKEEADAIIDQWSKQTQRRTIGRLLSEKDENNTQ